MKTPSYLDLTRLFVNFVRIYEMGGHAVMGLNLNAS